MKVEMINLSSRIDESADDEPFTEKTTKKTTKKTQVNYSARCHQNNI
jgi:hypothetical protein